MIRYKTLRAITFLNVLYIYMKSIKNLRVHVGVAIPSCLKNKTSYNNTLSV